ncbi:YlaH-like family protein [Lihuaxuella thermophila]|uniref:YlaH-like protein n=1 Tax=Lihuaxuella thermophila TaxID=1173111 RepID=A0A1H8DKP9_9BACL|nr:YlaH-like family protein [Lihuaxuella thermophila]SEN07813.1 YlaH-like protein [Lihuaxuella thermophila]
MLGALQVWLDGLHPLAIYLIILVLTGIIYKTAFARKLPPLKSLVVYLVLALGCLLLTLFHYMRFPMIPALFFTVILIVVTRVRLYLSKSKQEKTE